MTTSLVIGAVARSTSSYPVGHEAICYGPLHPGGARFPAAEFHRDPDRVNKLSELCIQCQDLVDMPADRRKCRRCGTVKHHSAFTRDMLGRISKWCKPCSGIREGSF